MYFPGVRLDVKYYPRYSSFDVTSSAISSLQSLTLTLQSFVGRETSEYNVEHM